MNVACGILGPTQPSNLQEKSMLASYSIKMNKILKRKKYTSQTINAYERLLCCLLFHKVLDSGT